MRAIINGVRYDTEKAVLIGEANNLGRGADSVTDFGYWSAALHRTPRSGRYFLAGEGGAMTRFARSISQNSWAGGARIIPLDKEDALAWAEENLPTDVVEQHFSAMIERDDEMRHYVMVDEFTGYIWGDYRSDKPEDEAIIEGCRAIDEEAGNPGRVYERRDQPSGDSCYYVYDATDLNLEIYDGQDQTMIDRVTDNARFVGIVGYTSDLDPDGAVS